MNLILILALGLLVFALIRYILVQAPRYGRPFLIRLGLILAAVVVFGLAVTGRLHWLFALLSGFLPFLGRIIRILGPLLKYLPLLKGAGAHGGERQRHGNQRSVVRTRLLEMELHHDSGEITGRVLAGTFAGRTLASLDRAELQQLHAECRNLDLDGARLLDTYIEHHYGEDWSEGDTPDQNQSSGSGAMSEEEALEILGLQPGASEADIIDAHRRLIARLHPDRGGSNYLAAKINQAKDFLLRHKRGKQAS